MRFILVLIVSLFLTSCGEEKIQFSDLEISDGKFYKKGDNKPYTGEVLEYPPFSKTVPIFSPEKVIAQRASLTREYIKKPMKHASNHVSAALFTFKDGLLDGDYIEYHRIEGNHLSQKRIVKLLGNFKQGKPHGTFSWFSVGSDRGEEPQELKNVKSKHYAFPIFEIATFNNGKLNGDYRLWLRKPKIYHANGGKSPTISAQFQEGKLEGDLLVYSKVFDSTLTFQGSYKNGLKNGLFVEYCKKHNFTQPDQIKKQTNFELNNQVGAPETFECKRSITKPRSSSGGSMSASQEQKLRKLAEDLYDKCQLYGKSYDSRC